MMTTTPGTTSAIHLLQTAILDLECRLGLHPGQEPTGGGGQKQTTTTTTSGKKGGKARPDRPQEEDPDTLPDICKLEFRVGVITRVWNHEEADKLYCEEIDVGEEEGGPRQIASGLRPHFTLEEMLGQRLLVVTNLKAKNLVRFKSHGMVLCAKETTEDGTERVEFIEPPPGAVIGEVVTFEGLPPPQPAAPAQVEKKKIFAICQGGMKTDSSCRATWNGHVFQTSAGPCRARTIAGGVMS
jgi:aminoacyl tRNA synthase complex-interacting multifunctional protein 1